VQVVDRCLAKDPARRWPDARSLKLALGAVEESPLPDALRTVEGKALLGAVVSAALLFVWWLVKPRVAATLVVYGAPWYAIFYLLAVIRLRREGFSLRQSQAALWREPSWWPFWYPRALRRRGNAWDRLPAAVRRLRGWLLVVCAYMGFSWGLAVTTERAGWRWPIELSSSLMIFGAAATVFWFVLKARAERELKRKGLAPADAHRVLYSVPPSRASFWARPHIAAVLAPATRPEPSLRADTPHDQLQSILHQADELSGPLRPLGAQAASAGRQLLAAIEHADREIAELARNLEPGEEERLADKIEALAAVPGRADDYAPMRALLEKQLELTRGLEARLEEARASRNRRVEILKTLALHVASLRARSAGTTSEVRSLSDSVRALCDDIGRQEIALANAATHDGIDQVATLDRNQNDLRR
jgi:hypothetical protein